ncbi:MAG TPA: bestrophin family ion channel [Ideonella sp.]|uniref:bestrophin family protein n=1 Tax=Ideonella sp. TaxID=1929293 RepID=UPI002C5E88D7|nr:bestrophin family ion channel [Ideonella sp.]HSI50278.1 bestrophin family ion channel [Ideonella sp.]
MIVRPRPHWLRLLFVRRGSLLRLILPQQLFTVGLACLVVLAHGQLFHWKVTLTASPFSLMGVSLAIFLGFRINASYDRYWEGRKLWGALLVDSRNLARQALTLTAPGTEVRPFVLGLAAFSAATRNQLRDQAPETGLAGLLPAEVLAQVTQRRCVPVAIALWLGGLMREWRVQDRLGPQLAERMEQSLDQLMAALGGCERIANTPLPFTYSVILHRSVYGYCMLLPFGLVDTIGWMTPLVVAFVSYTFFALEALSDEIEQPFGLMPNDLALDAMAAGIEGSLREMLGEAHPPLPVPDANYQLR